MSKRIIALLGCAVLLLGLLSGCKKEPAAGNIYEDYTPAGTLFLNFGASMEIVFDDEGNTLQILGTNPDGKLIATNSTSYLGEHCYVAAWKGLEYGIKNNLTGSVPLMVLRLDKGEIPPEDDFLLSMAAACQELADSLSVKIQVFALEGDQLDSEGLLTTETAKTLAAAAFGCTAADISGDVSTANGVYTLSYNGKTCTVDTFSGVVTLK